MVQLYKQRAIDIHANIIIQYSIHIGSIYQLVQLTFINISSTYILTYDKQKQCIERLKLNTTYIAPIAYPSTPESSILLSFFIGIYFMPQMLTTTHESILDSNITTPALPKSNPNTRLLKVNHDK